MKKKNKTSRLNVDTTKCQGGVNAQINKWLAIIQLTI